MNIFDALKAVTTNIQTWATGKLEKKQDELTGAEGQVVGFDAKGKAVAQEAPKGVSSWNDLTDKPFGEVDEAILPETELTFVVADGLDHPYATVESDRVDSTPNVTYRVLFDEKTYTCVSTEFPNMTPPASFLGNGAVYGFEDTGEPFFIMLQGSLFGFFDLGSSEPRTVSASILKPAVKKIDPAYLYQPDWEQSDEGQPNAILNRPFGLTQGVVVEEQTVSISSGMGYALLTANPVSGTKINVVWDTQTFICDVSENAGELGFGNLSILGAGDDTGEPFVCATSGGQLLVIPKDSSVTSVIFAATGVIVSKLENTFFDAKTVFYISADNYLYVDSGITAKATKNDILNAAKSSNVVLRRGSNYYFTPVIVNLVNSYAYVVVATAFDATTNTPGFEAYYTAEYTAT